MEREFGTATPADGEMKISVKGKGDLDQSEE